MLNISQLTLKAVVLLNISVKIMIDFLQDSSANRKLKAQRLFEIEMFCKFLLSSLIKFNASFLAPNIKAVLNKVSQYQQLHIISLSVFL